MRSAAGTLFANRFHIIGAALKRGGWAQAAVVLAFFAIGVAVFSAFFWFFLRAFRFILVEPLAGPLIIRYILEASFAFVFFLGVASAVVSSFSALFKADELRLLAAYPIAPQALFEYRFAAMAALSAWPVLLLAAPALLALGFALSAPVAYYVFCAALLPLFVASIAVIGGLLSFVVAPLARKVPAGWLHLIETMVFLAAAVALARRIMPRSVFAIFDVDTADGAAAAAQRLREMFAWLPSHPVATVAAEIVPFAPDAAPAAAVLFGFAAVVSLCAALLFSLGRRYYLPLWQDYGESGFLARPEDVPSGRPRRRFPAFFRFGHGFLFEKDLLSFLRNGEESARAGFLLLLLLLYLLAARAVSLVESFSRVDAYALVIVFAFSAIGYFALTFGLRFVFPSTSLEGRGAWLLWSSPIHAHEIFSWKFFFWATVITVISEFSTVLIAALFRTPLPLALFLAFAAFCTALTVTAVTLGQGSIFPNFRERDPDAMSTSPAGLAATGVGLAYLWIVSGYVLRAVRGYLATNEIDPRAMFGILIVSLALTAAYWAASHKAMDSHEFPS